jgi:hypothetical protein
MPPLFQWTVPLVAGGVCMLAAPLWMFGAPAVEDGALTSRQLALYVVLYYPSAIAMLFIVSRVHKLLTRKADRPRIELRYLTGANVCLGIAVLVMVAALIGMVR